jgi:hypothetical protein
MSSDVAGYLDRLRTHLRLGGGSDADVMRELAAHVEDRVEELVRRGVPAVRAQRIALDGLGRPRTLAHLLQQAHLITPWRDALFGAGAFAFLATVVGAQLWRVPALAGPSAAIVIAVTLYGLWLGRPAWFYPWAGVALSLPLVAGYIAFALLLRAAAMLSGGDVTPLALAGVAGAALYFPVGLVVVAAAILVAARRDWLDASVLLSPLPGVLVLIIAAHRAGGLASGADPVPTAALMLLATYGCASLGALLFLRAPTRQLKVMLLIGGALVLLGGATLLAWPDGGVVTLAGRAALLLAFLLSPALVARHA